MSMSEERTEIVPFRYSAYDLTTSFDFPTESSLSLNHLKGIYNAWQRGVQVDLYGRIWICQSELHNILRTKKENEEQDFAYLFTIDIDPPKKEMSRFLAKMALEAIAFRFLNVNGDLSLLIDEPHYDLIRNYARFGAGVKDWPYSRRSIFPMDTQMKHPETGEWVHAGFGHDLLMTSRRETYFVFLIYGVEFVINTGGPSIRGYEEWLEQHNGISPMVERVGARLITKVIDGKRQHFLEGDFEVRKGITFDIGKFHNKTLD